MASGTQGPSRNIRIGVWGVLLGALVVLVLAGGAFAVGRSTATNTTVPATPNQAVSPAPAGMMSGPWVRAHRDDIAWMQAHMHDLAWMRSHDGDWRWMHTHGRDLSWMRAHSAQWRWWMHTTPAQWRWMGAHRGDIAWMHDHWSQWNHWRTDHGSGPSGSGNGSGNGSWCGNGWICR